MASITNIVVACPAHYVEEIRREVTEIFGSSKNIAVIAGGTTRQESVFLGLHKLSELGKPDYVLVHDAARPFVSDKIVTDAISTVTTRGACTVATPVSDTLKKVTEDKISSTVDRDHLYAVQTPQAAPFDLLYSCHQKAREENIGVTDDAAILEQYGYDVVIFEGSNNNVKVTVLDDFRACELLAPLFLPDAPI